MSPKPRIEIDDVTCRDGAQGFGMNLSTADKLQILHTDDGLGFHLAEAGFPHPDRGVDNAVFRQLLEEPLLCTRWAAFGMTHRKETTPEKDEGLRALLASGAPVITLVGKASRFQVSHVLETTPTKNLRMIRNSFTFLRDQAPDARLIFDAEHFFDGQNGKKADREYALACMQAAVAGGADTLVACDTNGGSTPEHVGRTMEALCREFRTRVIGVHCHNDRGFAEANTHMAVIAAKEVGIDTFHIQGTWNGYGERAGNADLCVVIPNLAQEGYRVPPTATFTALSGEMDRLARQMPFKRQPYVGKGAFAHKGGMHGSGMARHLSAYEHCSPALVGNRRRFPGSNQAGLSHVRLLAGENPLFDAALKRKVKRSPALQRKTLQAIAKAGEEGYTYDSAPASLELLMLRAVGEFIPTIQECKKPVVHDELGASCEATIKVIVNGSGQPSHVVSEGHGPLGALSNALFKAMLEPYPELTRFHLVHYGSRMIPGPTQDMQSRVQVTTDFTDGETVWSTAGVHEDSTLAGWIACKDAIEYMLLLHGHTTRKGLRRQPHPKPKAT